MTRPDASVYADILANPDDDGLRRVFADHLIERGDPRGELIIVQCELWRCADDDPRYQELASRESALLPDATLRWWTQLGLPDDIKPGALILRRGLVEQLKLPVEQLARIEGVLARLPLRALIITHVNDAGAAALARLPAIATLTRIHLRNGEIGVAGAEALGAAPLVAHVREIELQRLNIAHDALHRLAHGKAFAGLSAFSAMECNARMRELADAPWLPQLRSLVLARMANDVAAALEGDRWRELAVLDLDGSYLTDVELARIPTLYLAPLLTHLALPASHAGPETVRALITTRRLAKLQQLALRGYCQLDPQEIATLRGKFGDKLVLDGPLHALP